MLKTHLCHNVSLNQRQDEQHMSYMSEEPESKSMTNVCPPIDTGERNSALFCDGDAVTSPFSELVPLTEASVDALSRLASSPPGLKLMSSNPNLKRARRRAAGPLGT